MTRSRSPFPRGAFAALVAAAAALVAAVGAFAAPAQNDPAAERIVKGWESKLNIEGVDLSTTFTLVQSYDETLLRLAQASAVNGDQRALQEDAPQRRALALSADADVAGDNQTLCLFARAVAQLGQSAGQRDPPRLNAQRGPTRHARPRRR